jgi:hypothetical protein
MSSDLVQIGNDSNLIAWSLIDFERLARFWDLSLSGLRTDSKSIKAIACIRGCYKKCPGNS